MQPCDYLMRRSKKFVLGSILVLIILLIEMLLLARGTLQSSTDKNKESLADTFNRQRKAPYPHRAYLPAERIGEEFPHWELLTNPSRGVTRQQILNSVPICADLLTLEAMNGGGQKQPSLFPWLPMSSNRDRLWWLSSRYGCDWYQVEAHNIMNLSGRQAAELLLSPNSSAVAKAVLDALLDQVGEDHPSYVVAESPHWVDVGVTNATIALAVVKVRPTDTIIERQYLASIGADSDDSTYFSHQQLLDLSPTSPLLMHYLTAEMVSFRGSGRALQGGNGADSRSDGSAGQPFRPNALVEFLQKEGQASSVANSMFPVSVRELQSLVTALAHHSPQELSPKVVRGHLAALRKEWDMHAKYNGLLQGHSPRPKREGKKKSLMQYPLLQHGPLHTTGQLAATLRNRLVRLSPSGSPFFEASLVEGMRKVGNGIMEGVLTHASERVNASPTDALAGHWNSSDLPSWLVIPSAVNVANCLDPLNLRANEKTKIQLDESHHQPQRSVLIVGSSHARNLFTQLCSSYIMSRIGRLPKGMSNSTLALHRLCKPKEVSGVSRKDLADTFEIDETLIPPPKNANNDPFPIVYCSTQLSYFDDIDRCAAYLLSHLGHQVEEAPTKKANETQTIDINQDTLLGLRNQLPAFAHKAGEYKSQTFSYTDFLLNGYSSGARAALKGIFSHIILLPGPWELIYQDQTIGEQTENVAVILDLLEELFAPREKILLYNLHSFHVYSHIHVDPSNALKNVREGTVPSFAGISPTMRKRNDIPFELEEDLFSPANCRNPFRSAKFRDAHLLARSSVTRKRVRDAWNGRFSTMLTTTSSTSPPSSLLVDSLVYRSPVEVLDFLPATSQSLGKLFVDHQGHHFRDIVLDAMTQRLLRDHVCPPAYVMAVRPKGAAAGDEALPSTSLVNHAGSKLPVDFPFKDGVDVDYIRVQTSKTSASRMPVLAKARSDRSSSPSGRPSGNKLEWLITDLFPLLKTPREAVTSGLFSAVFDGERSYTGEGALAAGRGANSPLLVGTLNQYDPFGVSPLCSCLRPTALFYPAMAGNASMALSATNDQLRAAVTSDASELGRNLRYIRGLIGEEEGGAGNLGSGIEFSKHLISQVVTFPLAPSSCAVVSPKYLLNQYACKGNNDDPQRPVKCAGSKGVLTVNTIEELRRRMIAFAFIKQRA